MWLRRSPGSRIRRRAGRRPEIDVTIRRFASKRSRAVLPEVQADVGLVGKVSSGLEEYNGLPKTNFCICNGGGPDLWLRFDQAAAEHDPKGHEVHFWAGALLSGGRRVPGAEITARLSGQTLRDVFGTYTWSFGTNGTFSWGGNGGASGNWLSSGTWLVEDDALCWISDGYEMGCRAVFDWDGILRIAKKDRGLESWGIY